MRRGSLRLVGISTLAAFLLGGGFPATAASCPAADPNDSLSDSASLQACLDVGGIVELAPGSPGYLLDEGLVVTKSGTLLKSATIPARATIKAMPQLVDALLTIELGGNVNNVQIIFIRFDGDRNNRTGLSNLCQSSGPLPGAQNVRIRSGANHKFNDNESVNALCGSALYVEGENFEVAYNYITNAGESPWPNSSLPNGIAPQADGITVAGCFGTAGNNVHHNTVTDATDIGIVLFKGQNCQIHHNTVRQISRRAFVGIALGPQPGPDVNFGNSDVYENDVFGGALMSVGIEVGSSTFFGQDGQAGCGCGKAISGKVRLNTVTGAKANLYVDWATGTIVNSNNDLSQPASNSPNPNCSPNPPPTGWAQGVGQNYILHAGAHTAGVVTLEIPTANASLHHCHP